MFESKSIRNSRLWEMFANLVIDCVNVLKIHKKIKHNATVTLRHSIRMTQALWWYGMVTRERFSGVIFLKLDQHTCCCIECYINVDFFILCMLKIFVIIYFRIIYIVDEYCFSLSSGFDKLTDGWCPVDGPLRSRSSAIYLSLSHGALAAYWCLLMSGRPSVAPYRETDRSRPLGRLQSRLKVEH